MINVGIFGATGYTGYELVKLLGRHPHVRIAFATSMSHAGRRLDAIYPQAPPLALVEPGAAPLQATDLVFSCLPHAAAATSAVAALEAGTRVIDLSADFRLRDADVYETWYGVSHPAAALLAEAVYGLTEFARTELKGARLVATPGCYPTSILLALRPLFDGGVDIAGTIVADSKSGVSGAGRAPRQNTHFVEVVDNFSPYKIGRAHRHLPEMEQILSWWHPSPPALVFAPHLLPVSRGILSSLYVPLTADWSEEDLYGLYAERYAGEPFVCVLPPGQVATLAHVTHTNRCAISLKLEDRLLIINSAIDNLLKGAAGQAVQNMNVVFGFEEKMALCF